MSLQRKGKDPSSDPCVKSVPPILLAFHSGCQAANDWGYGRMVFTLTWKSAVDPRNPFWLACLWTQCSPMKALWVLTNPLHLHFVRRKLKLIRNFCKFRCSVLHQTLKRGNGKEESGCSLNPFSWLTWSENIPLMNSSESGASQVLPVPLGLCCCLTYLHMKASQYSSNTVDFSSLAEERAEGSSQIPCTVAMVLPWTQFRAWKLYFQGKY